MVRTIQALAKIYIVAALAAAATAGPALAQNAAENPSWSQPVAPFRIAPRLYYVGSRDIGAFLVDSGKGLILLDAGVPSYAGTVLANIRALGFDPGKVRILLNSQAHLDHAGGLAAIKAATGAKMLASAADAALLERGGKGDFAWGDDLAYPPVKVDRIIRNAEKLKLGAVRLTAHLTPGHTKGCTTWTMPVVEGGRAYTAQFASCTTAPGYKLLGTPAYPEMAADYAATFAKLRRLPCDFFLGTHGSFFDLDAKRAKLAGRPAVNPFLDPQGCRNFIATSEQRFKDQLAREQSVLRE